METPRVIFITDNGHGLGHLTRMMAIASHAEERFQPVFLTMSQAYSLVREFGWPVEHLPSYTKFQTTRGQWQPIFTSRLAQLMESIEPRAVVVDHIFPPQALRVIRSDTTGTAFIWSRRGMWKSGRNRDAIRRSRYFDFIVEPRDVAGPIDMGLTSTDRSNVTLVDPVVFVSPRQMVDRDEARRVLGLPESGLAVLVQLSDSDPEQAAAQTARVRDVVLSHAGGRPVHLFSPLHPLHQGDELEMEGVTMRPVYPLAIHHRAFDAIITTAGYNSFHEVVASGVPAVFVARQTDSLDDQARRASFAELSGRGFHASSVESGTFSPAVRKALDPGERELAARTAEDLLPFDGGRQFADVIVHACARAAEEPFSIASHLKTTSAPPTVLKQLTGSDGDVHVSKDREIFLVVAMGHTTSSLVELVDNVTAHERSDGGTPIFLIDEVDPSPLVESGLHFESLMSEEEHRTTLAGGYSEYVESAIDAMSSRYQPARIYRAAKD